MVSVAQVSSNVSEVCCHLTDNLSVTEKNRLRTQNCCTTLKKVQVLCSSPKYSSPEVKKDDAPDPGHLVDCPSDG